jgi:hypothetical protein
MTSQAEQPERYLRRVQAAKHVEEEHNQPCSPRTLAKLASQGCDGPPFLLAGRFPLYPVSELDKWARSKMGPLVRSVAEARDVAQSQSEKKSQRHDPPSQDQFVHARLPGSLDFGNPCQTAPCEEVVGAAAQYRPANKRNP